MKRSTVVAVAVAVVLVGIALVVATTLDSGAKADMPRTAIVSAFGAELQTLLDETTDKATVVYNGHTFTTGKLRGHDVVLFLSGVSMENAAMNVQVALDKFNVGRIVFSGIAGGVNPSLNIGDVTVPAKWALYQKQLYARQGEGDTWLTGKRNTEFGHFGMMFPQYVRVTRQCGEADTTESKFWFDTDPQLLAVAQKVKVDLLKCTPENVCLSHQPIVKVGGNGVSGPTFVDNAAYRAWAWETFEADALDMETAAAYLVAYTNCRPILAFRSLSDLAGGGPGENEIGTYFKLAADNAANVLLAFLDELPE